MPSAELIVFDDDSDDAQTLSILEDIRKKHRVVTPEKAETTKHGGLYYNMQRAIEALEDTSTLTCFLQDDTQVTRPIWDEEILALNRLFSENGNLGFVQPCFLRNPIASNQPFEVVTVSGVRLFYRKGQNQSAGLHYSDLLITSPARLLKWNWVFKTSEPDNDHQARTLFGPMPYLFSPFAMWLPNVPAYRGKKKTWALKYAEKQAQCGYYPFEIWSTEQTKRFLARTAERPPVAEAYLTCQGYTPASPWRYNPLSGRRLLKHINSAETFLHRYVFWRLKRLR